MSRTKHDSLLEGVMQSCASQERDLGSDVIGKDHLQGTVQTLVVSERKDIARATLL